MAPLFGLNYGFPGLPFLLFSTGNLDNARIFFLHSVFVNISCSSRSDERKKRKKKANRASQKRPEKKKLSKKRKTSKKHKGTHRNTHLTFRNLVVKLKKHNKQHPKANTITMLRFKRLASSAAGTYNQARILRKYPVGATYHGYEVKRLFPVPELQMVGVELVHAQTGSQHLHLDRNDSNNVFSLIFKTNPPDKTGVPHILEHTTLCGSAKYPVRDPFFKMLNRSLSNFMNAMTAHDYTYYPFATTNLKDYHNLMDIYIDSTLRPLLNYKDFCQEGWRLENEKVDDKNSPLVFKGVVYNEMKGQMSNLQYYFYSKFKEAIYPSLNNSGGDPLHITSLYHSDLLSFHSKNYHPSNMKTFSYGNNPLQETLLKLNDSLKQYGKRYTRKDAIKVPLVLPATESGKAALKLTKSSPLDSMLPPDRQIKSSLTWILNNPNEELYETFLLKVLSVLLFDGTNSPFYKKLIESGAAYEFSCNTGLESMTSKNFISVGLQGISSDFLTNEFEQTILDILKNDCMNDMSLYSKTKVQALINQMELSLKNQQSQFGLTILSHILPQWVNHADPFELINFTENVDLFKEDFAGKGAKLFTDLIEKHLINKPYFHFTMTGDEKFHEVLKSKEAAVLEEKLETLDPEDRKIIYERNLENSKESVEAKEDLSVLPSLQVSDIAKNGLDFPVNVDSKVFSRITNTNGISYVKFKKSMQSAIPLELLPYLSFFSECLTFLGTKTQDYDEIEDEIKLHTGGVSIGCRAQTSSHDINASELFLEFSGWSLNSKMEHIFDIWVKLLKDTDFSMVKVAKLKTLIKSLSSSTSSSFSDSGHSYAKSYAAASLSKTYSLSEHLGGVKESQFINKLNTFLNDESKIQTEIIDKLIFLQKHILHSLKNAPESGISKSFIITDEPKQVGLFAHGVDENFLSKMDIAQNEVSHDQASSTAKDIKLLPNQNKSVIDFPFQVYHTSKVLKGVSYTHEDGPKLQLLSTLLTNKILHNAIREKNGAYGGGASFSAVDGIFNFYSYRDPNPLKSMQIFDDLCDSEKSKNFNFNWTQQDLDEAKLSIFQRLDAPVSPRNEGLAFFEYGLDYEAKEKRRSQLLNCDLKSVFEANEKYLQSSSHNKDYAVAVVGDAHKDEHNFQEQNYNIIKPSN